MKKKPLRTFSIYEPAPSWLPATTTKEIIGTAIKTIPIGTSFKISYIHLDWSVCTGLEIDQIWNDEYKLCQ